MMRTYNLIKIFLRKEIKGLFPDPRAFRSFQKLVGRGTWLYPPMFHLKEMLSDGTWIWGKSGLFQELRLRRILGTVTSQCGQFRIRSPGCVLRSQPHGRRCFCDWFLWPRILVLYSGTHTYEHERIFPFASNILERGLGVCITSTQSARKGRNKKQTR